MTVVTRDQVEKALIALESQINDDVVKASDDDLDQPEGSDLGNPAKEKMSDAAKAKKAKKSWGATKKGDDDEEDLEESFGSDDEDDDDEPRKKAFGKKENPFAKKSFNESMPEEIETKIDVSDFLKSLVSHTGECIDNLSEFVIKGNRIAKSRYETLEEAVDEVQKSQAKIGIVLKAICQRIGVVSAAPSRGTRSETFAKSTSTDRSFSSALETEDNSEKMFKSLSDSPTVAKSQIASALCDLVRKGEAADLDVIGFESGGFIRPELVSKLKTVLN